MYSQNAAMAPQKPETFMLSTEAQQALPQDAQVALQQVDNCMWTDLLPNTAHELTLSLVKYFLISAPVDWQPDQYIRRFLLPTGEYVSCVLWYVLNGDSHVKMLANRRC